MTGSERQATTTPQTRLSETLGAFVAIENKDFHKCYQSFSRKVWEEPTKPLLQSAKEQLAAEKTANAYRLIQRYLLLSTSSEDWLPQANQFEQRKAILKNLASDEKGYRNSLDKLCSQRLEELTPRPARPSSNTTRHESHSYSVAARPRVASISETGPYRMGSTNPLATHPVLGQNNSEAVQRHNDSSSDSRMPAATRGQIGTGATLSLKETIADTADYSDGDLQQAPVLTIGPSPAFVPRGLGDTDNKNYRLLTEEFRVFRGRDPIDTVFGTGAVLAVFWHEHFGQNAPKFTSAKRKAPVPGRFGSGYISLAHESTLVFSHVKRFAVAKQRHGYSIAVPISSYGGFGLSKKKLSLMEQQAHAIIYDSRKQPQRLRDEPQFSKKPVRVDCVEGETLTDFSRVNYGQLSTIQHNIRVKRIGRIHRDDLGDFIRNCRSELGGGDAARR